MPERPIAGTFKREPGLAYDPDCQRCLDAAREREDALAAWMPGSPFEYPAEHHDSQHRTKGDRILAGIGAVLIWGMWLTAIYYFVRGW